MTTAVRRFTSLAVVQHPSRGAVTLYLPEDAGSAGAASPALTVTTSNLSFGEATPGTTSARRASPSRTRPVRSSRSPSASVAPRAMTSPGRSSAGCPTPSDAAEKSSPWPPTRRARWTCTSSRARSARNADLTLSDPAAAGASITLQGTGGIGYYQVSSNGVVGYAGDAGDYGDASNVTLNHPIVGMAQTGDGGGYWLVASDGGIFNYGDAPSNGSTGGLGTEQADVGHGL